MSESSSLRERHVLSLPLDSFIARVVLLALAASFLEKVEKAKGG